MESSPKKLKVDHSDEKDIDMAVVDKDKTLNEFDETKSDSTSPYSDFVMDDLKYSHIVSIKNKTKNVYNVAGFLSYHEKKVVSVPKSQTMLHLTFLLDK